jgi:hypothetical protein
MTGDKVKPLNKAEIGGTCYLSNPCYLLDNIVLEFEGEQCNSPMLIHTEPLHGVDTPPFARRMEIGFALAIADVKPYLLGLKRVLRDRVWGTWRFLAERSIDRDVAQMAFFHLELFWLAQDELSTAVGDLLPGPELDAVLVTEKLRLEQQVSDQICELMVTASSARLEAGAPQPTVDDFADRFMVKLDLQIAPRVNHLADLSELMITEVVKLATRVMRRVAAKHEMQYGELCKTYYSKGERQQHAVAKSHSGLNESILSQMDHLQRWKPTQRTANQSGMAVARQEKTAYRFAEKLLDPVTSESARADARAGQRGAKEWLMLDKRRCVEIMKHRAAEAKRKKARKGVLVHARKELKRQRLSVPRVEDVNQVLRMTPTELGAQFVNWFESYAFGDDDDDGIWQAISVAASEFQRVHDCCCMGDCKCAPIVVADFKKKLQLGKQEGGPQKDPVLYKLWISRKRAQLRAVITLYVWQQSARGCVIAEDFPAENAEVLLLVGSLVSLVEAHVVHGSDLATTSTNTKQVVPIRKKRARKRTQKKQSQKVSVDSDTTSAAVAGDGEAKGGGGPNDGANDGGEAKDGGEANDSGETKDAGGEGAGAGRGLPSAFLTKIKN